MTGTERERETERNSTREPKSGGWQITLLQHTGYLSTTHWLPEKGYTLALLQTGTHSQHPRRATKDDYPNELLFLSYIIVCPHSLSLFCVDVSRRCETPLGHDRKKIRENRERKERMKTIGPHSDAIGLPLSTRPLRGELGQKKLDNTMGKRDRRERTDEIQRAQRVEVEENGRFGRLLPHYIKLYRHPSAVSAPQQTHTHTHTHTHVIPVVPPSNSCVYALMHVVDDRFGTAVHSSDGRCEGIFEPSLERSKRDTGCSSEHRSRACGKDESYF